VEELEARWAPTISPATSVLNFTDFTSTAGLRITGSTVQLGNVLELTNDKIQAGNVFSTTPVTTTTSFSTHFTFNLHDGSNPAADGITFIIQNSPDGAHAKGMVGSQVGYGGIPNSLAVEFDIHAAQVAADQGSNNHIAILTGGNINDLQLIDPGFPLYGSGSVNAWVDYDATNHLLNVFASQGTVKPTTPVITNFSIDLSQAVGSSGFVGFGAGTGSLTAKQDIVNWQFWQTTSQSPVAPTTGVSFPGAVGSFSDTNLTHTASNFTATVDWGDHTKSSGTISGGLGLFSVSGPHIYKRAGSYNVSVTVPDVGGGSIVLNNSAVVTNPVQQAFVIGQDNQVYAETFSDSGTPTGKYSLTTPGTVKAIDTGRDTDGDPLLFAIGLDNQAYEQQFDSNGKSATPYTLAAAGQVKSIAVGHDAAYRPQLFAIGMDDQVYTAQFDASSNPITGFHLTQPGAVKSIVVSNDANGHPLLFATGQDNQVYEQKFDANGNSLTPYFLAAGGQVKAIAVGPDASFHPELFVIGMDNQVYAHMLDGDGNAIGSYFLTSPGVVKSIHVSSDGVGNPLLFAQGQDNQGYEQQFLANGNPIGGYFLTATGAVKSLTTSHDTTNNPELFALGLDNQAYFATMDATGTPIGSYVLVANGKVKAGSTTP
jgi:hypothetical protein